MTQEAVKPGFAVLDFETNGLGPWEDILEIGVVLLDSDLKVEGEFGTLVNSNKRVKNPWAHGIDNPQLAGAPTEPIAVTHLLSLLSGRYVVAHNAGFEKRYLDFHADLYSLGGKDTEAVKLIDTMPIAQELTGKRKLTDVSAIMQIQHNAHTALSDAQVTAVILQRAAELGSAKFKSQLENASVWPARSKSSIKLPQLLRLTNDELGEMRAAWLESITYSGSPASEENVQAYRELVVLFSLNFDLSELEKAELALAITTLELDRSSVDAVHEQVLAQLVAVRFPAAVIDRRKYLLTNLAQSLGLAVGELKIATNGVDPHELLKPGHKLMLTGRFSENQDRLNSMLKRKGFEITKQVSEADVVVTGYKDSTNKQIRDAKDSRKPVIAELSLLIFLG